MITEFSRSVTSSIDEEIGVITQALVDGRVDNHADYRELVGKLRGLAMAREHINDRARAYTEE